MNTRREIPNLPATMYYFVYSQSLPACKVDFINELKKKEKKKKDPSSKKKIVNCVGDKAKDDKKRWIIIKTSNGRKFQFT